LAYSSSVPHGVAVTASAALTPVGHDVDETCAAIRAGLGGFGLQPFLHVETPDPEWDPRENLRGAAIPGITSAQGPHRLVELGLAALRQLVKGARLGRAELRNCALLLALPEPDAVVDAWSLAELPAELCRRAGWSAFSVVRSHSGHSAALTLLAEAQAVFDARQARSCILLAVDSYLDFYRLKVLDAAYRVKTDRCPDGFLPGEAAVALLLEPVGETTRAVTCTLSAPGVAREPHIRAGELSSSGRGLQQAIEAVLAGRTAPWVLCDLNGESYRTFEWGTVRTRLANAFSAVKKLVHPADCVGDVGAASGAVLISCAERAFVRGYAPADDALIWTSSDGDTRAAVIASRPA
jgi:3-oxoacyl-[acyl-carrier-protein] synthase I